MTKEETKAFLEKNPVFVAVLGLAVLSSLTKPLAGRKDIPGPYERRNAAWRGKGSYGSAPFGKQSSHRR